MVREESALADSDRYTDETSVITCDMNGTVQQYSADAEALFGWTRDEVIGKMSVAWFHVPKNVPTLVPRLLKEAIEKGKFKEEVTLMRKDGATFQAVLTVRSVLRDGRQVGFMGMTKPLTLPSDVPVRQLWFQALRAPFLIASVIPVLVGALAAWTIRGAFDPSFFVLCLLGAMSIHLGANMANDAWDYRSGNDLAVRHLNPFAGGGRVLLRGVLSVRSSRDRPVAFPRSPGGGNPVDQRGPRYPRRRFRREADVGRPARCFAGHDGLREPACGGVCRPPDRRPVHWLDTMGLVGPS